MRHRGIVKNRRWITVYEDGQIFSHAFVSCIGRKIKGRFLKSRVDKDGYEVIALSGKDFKVHRLVCEAFHQDYCETLQVDHINGVKNDNRVCNLRMVTQSENQRGHRTVSLNASSQYRGVCWCNRNKKWVVHIRLSGKLKYLGSFHDELDAARAFNEAAIEHGFLPEALNKLPSPNQPLTQAEFAFA